VSEGDRLTNHAVLSELPSALYRISSTPYRAMTSMHVTLLMQNVLTGFFTINLLTDSCRSRKLAVFCISFSMISTLNSSGPKKTVFFGVRMDECVCPTDECGPGHGRPARQRSL
jgi:hypothetical protein